ncbi:choline dehydrogenase [Amaricoccus macauensis]|uniref:Choline dehydrogenase n=1 Tax=Amaricoccus macauensis TaxID=57001 RepID=A0A840SNI2_9RHOB|nr:choline dehydrogenase [Amaricoccus macauensis]MBB5220973.1 choline dehydrogenase [Amaricoccus macauensis]
MEADYVIIGSGSAGAAIAYRLGEAGHSVLVIEYGGTDWGPFIQMPAALSYPMNMARYDWGFHSEPEPHLGGRTLVTPRGKVLGGSSSINGMVYVRGHPRDFDTWAEMGAEGWSFADVLPYFIRQENWHGGHSVWRGDSGPLHVTRGPRRNPLYHSFVEAGAQAGFELTFDYNGQKQEGFGPMEQTVWRGRRWSVANAYLRPALRRGNVRVISGLATRVVIEAGRARGVEVRQGENTRVIAARREVIVSASSINSPKLLMLSGIGPAAHLAEHGIEVIADRPGVGANLQDHLEMYFQLRSLKPVTLYSVYNYPGMARIGAQWLLAKMGLGTSNQFESAAFVRSRPGVEYPDIQYHFLPLAVSYDGKSAVKGHGFQAHVGPMRSPSRGTVRLKSANPAEAPAIRFNYMESEQDWIDFRHCIRLTRQIFAQSAFAPYAGDEIQPGAALQTDDELDGFLREHVESAYHPCGTARLGRRDDPMAVVDPECRVIGVEGLRVADSSIFPRITNGNLNAPSIMVGEKAADHILGTRLPPSSLEPWINPRWRETDR